MPFKGQITGGTCVLFERPVSADALSNALSGFNVVRRTDGSDHWAFGGPGVSIAFRPEINGYVAVKTTDRPWPDEMGDPATEPMVFGAWSMGHFGPFTYPGSLERAAQHSWGWPEGKTVANRHTAFVRILASYVFGEVSGDTPIFPAEYDAVGELAFLTDVALAVMAVPGALCYFNPNGESLRSYAGVKASLTFATEQTVPPLDVYCNVRLFNVDEGWLVMDTVGNGQLGLPDLPDLEACVKKNKGYNLQEVDAFLRNTTLYVWRQGEVFRDGDTIDGPGGVRWRARVRKQGLLTPPRRTLRFFPEDGTKPPDVVFRDRDTE